MPSSSLSTPQTMNVLAVPNKRSATPVRTCFFDSSWLPAYLKLFPLVFAQCEVSCIDCWLPIPFPSMLLCCCWPTSKTCLLHSPPPKSPSAWDCSLCGDRGSFRAAAPPRVPWTHLAPDTLRRLTDCCVLCVCADGRRRLVRGSRLAQFGADQVNAKQGHISD